MSYAFDLATALERIDERRFRGRIIRDFWVMVGPNGGYLAAIALRGATLALGDPARAPRSMHIRYLSPPREGDFELETSVLRAGRSMTILVAALRQGGRESVNASICFSASHNGPSFQDRTPPEARALADAVPMPKAIPLNDRFDQRVAIGGPPRTGARAETGGYMRFADGRPLDMLALAAMWDTWPPAVFYRATEPALSSGVPTVEASIYFRRQLPFEGFRADDYLLTHIRSAVAHDGFIEEDADLWSRDGQLLVQSRQLALCR